MCGSFCVHTELMEHHIVLSSTLPQRVGVLVHNRPRTDYSVQFTREWQLTIPCSITIHQGESAV